ncbi:lipoate--protein ligase family protein [Cohnella nanjingensis]|uniref:Lipoate--protein ligase family protein n=1 Tax=Cohnella nanjingensis TaxID=1387779 RepID=A0A7X0RX14_9BACL|nr:lipoate--protein ligase family protein [Cohnella nanjingensis]MBB6675193.1 lipoate--protein ligase family protein [Cohnella nanjingensis]
MEGEQSRDWLASLTILDRTADLADRDALHAFALDELLCKRAGEGGPPVCHLWRHPRAFVLGLKDSRLPGAAKASRYLAEAGYEAVVRHSGGAAVPLDPGVVNVSLILPKAQTADMRFHGDFERMYELVSLALDKLGCRADKGEIAGSYCPGDYDLSIGGRKFCGIAQRRQVRSYIVQAFIVAEGSGAERAAEVREFYRLAGEGADPAAYPAVVPDRTASLEELAGLPPGTGAAAFAEAVKQTIRDRHLMLGAPVPDAAWRMPSDEEVRAAAGSLRARYGQILMES